MPPIDQAAFAFAPVRLSAHAETRLVTDAAIARAERHAASAWMDAAERAIERTCREMPTWLVDDVQARMPAGVSTPDGRAMGAAIRAAERRGLCRSTGRTRKSEQRQCHGNFRTEWESLVYAGGTE